MVGDLFRQMEEDELEARLAPCPAWRERYLTCVTVRAAPGLAEYDVVTAATRGRPACRGHPSAPRDRPAAVGLVSIAALEHASCPVAVVPVRSS